MIKIVGIDPGLAATGIGIVRGNGSAVDEFAFTNIRTSSARPVAERLNGLYGRLQSILADEAPDLMVVEDVFSLPRNPKSGIMLGKVSGVILLAGYRADVRVTEVAVREAKQVLTGNGNASKEQLEAAVRHLLHLTRPIRPFHASDALALALIGLWRWGDVTDNPGESLKR